MTPGQRGDRLDQFAVRSVVAVVVVVAGVARFRAFFLAVFDATRAAATLVD